MLHRSRLILTALAASALLALAVGDASAGRFSTNEKNFELIWDNALANKTKIELIDTTAGINIQCKLTLLGHFTNSTIIKATGLTQGAINHGTLNECEGGSATLRVETFPWNQRFRSFTGSLPNIRSITNSLLGARFRFESAGTACETATEANHPALGIIEGGLETTGEPEEIIADRNGKIPLRGAFNCGFAGEGEFGGRGLIRNLPRTGKLHITLI